MLESICLLSVFFLPEVSTKRNGQGLSVLLGTSTYISTLGGTVYKCTFFSGNIFSVLT